MKEIFSALMLVLFIFGVLNFDLLQTTQFKDTFLSLAAVFMLTGAYIISEAIYEFIAYYSEGSHDRT